MVIIALGEVGLQSAAGRGIDRHQTEAPTLDHQLHLSASLHRQLDIVAVEGTELPYPLAGVVEEGQQGPVPPAGGRTGERAEKAGALPRRGHAIWFCPQRAVRPS
jgi:hypothetical protein